MSGATLYLDYLTYKSHIESDYDVSNKTYKFKVIHKEYKDVLSHVIYTGNIYKVILLFYKHLGILLPNQKLMHEVINYVIFEARLENYVNGMAVETEKLGIKYPQDSMLLMERIVFYIVMTFLDDKKNPILQRIC